MYEAIEPVFYVFAWMRSQPIVLFGHTFSFMDVFMWSILAGITIHAIRRVFGI